MRIKDLFEKNINRNINPVVKVSDSAKDTLQQELEEYVVTKELKPHFHKFFTNFSESYEVGTDQMGVWISGFYGSGKSHFLKILSYLLENKEVNGKNTIEYFRNKFDDPMEFDMIERCCSKGNNKTILFNVDSLTGDKTKTAIKDVFAQVFYDSIGYFGRDIKVVKFEQNLDKLGKLDAFKTAFSSVAGDSWENLRDAFDFYADLIIDALTEAGIMSRASAENLVYTKDTAVFSIDTLADDIKAYVDAQSKDFKLIFMVDEIAQYIGEDLNLMLNLQTIVEDLGTKCKGKVWVIVTGQEAIDQIIKVKGEQLSKIMGRFATRLHLTASSVEEVVKKRLLSKNTEGANYLQLVYESKSASLKNTFTFEQAVADLKGYTSEENFVEVYPFVPYQFRLFQDVMNALREHKQVNEQTAGNARSMVGACHSGLTEAKSNVLSFANYDISASGSNKLFSFERFFDTISEKLIFQPREVIQRASDAADNHDGLEAYDVRVLKLLYLIRYVDKDVKATVNNLAIMITDAIDEDQISLRKKVFESLERLRMQNYVLKNGDVYTFLSNEEKEVETEIQATHIDQEELSKAIGDIVFGDIYSSKKAKYGVYDFEFGRFVDDMPIGPSFDALKFMVITPGNPLSDPGNEATLIFESMKDGRVICVLSNENDFYEKMRDVAKVEKYNKTKNQSSLAQSVKSAIAARVSQVKLDRIQINASIENALKNANFYINGGKATIKGSNAKEKVLNALTELVTAVYTELDKVTYNFNSPDDIKGILTQDENTLVGRMITNPDAVAALEQFLNLRYQSMATVTVSDVYKRYQNKPYGYKEYDIAAMIAELMVDQKVVLSYNGKEFKKNDSQVSSLLFNKSYIDSVIIKQRIAVDPVLLTKCINIMKDFTNSMDVPSKEDAFIEYAINTLQKCANECDGFITNYYSNGNYPQKEAVNHAKGVYNEILLYKGDATKFLNKIKEKQDDMLDAQADISDVVSFFKGAQKTIFDSASNRCKFYSIDLSYINEDSNAKTAYDSIKAILAMDRPFSKIASLSGLVNTLEQAHKALLETKKNAALNKIDAIKNELYSYVKEYSKDIYNSYVGKLTSEISFIENASNIVAVAAEDTKINDIKNGAIAELLAAKPVPVNPIDPVEVKEPTDITKDELIEVATLKTQGEVDQYIERLKSKLYKYIPNGGVKIK